MEIPKTKKLLKYKKDERLKLAKEMKWELGK